MYKLAWHFDFHSHKNIRINEKPNVETAARIMSDCGIEEIITFAKGHCGFCYYPAKTGYPHPRMKGDPFGDFVGACKKRNIRVLAYISFGIDGEGARHNPHWLQIMKPDAREISADWFNKVCPFSPYLEESVLPMIDEIIDNYPVDGFFFDTMSALRYCYCDSCKKAFRDMHGIEIPEDPEDKNWGIYGEFRHKRGIEMIAKVGKAIRKKMPDAKVGFNQIGTIHYPETPPEGLSCLTLDFATSGPQSLQASLCAALGSSSPLQSDVMNTIYTCGWGDWSPRPPESLEQAAVPVWARGARPYIGDRFRPENRLDKSSVTAMKYLKKVYDKIRTQYPDTDAEAAHEILILHGPKQAYGNNMEGFATDRKGTIKLAGAHRMLLDCGMNFSISAEYTLEEKLKGCKLLILPEMKGVETETLQSIEDYVREGGKVLLVGEIPEGFKLAGLEKEDKPWQDHIYLPQWYGASAKSPVLVRGNFHKLCPDTAETACNAIQPYDCEYGIRFGWGIGPASDKESPYPALTLNRVGNGEVWYLEAPVFTDYIKCADWNLFHWFRDLLSKIENFEYKAVSDAGNAELVVHANKKSSWLFMINHGGEQSAACTMQKWTRTLGPLPPYSVRITVKDAQKRLPESIESDGIPLEYKQENDEIEIPVILDRTWKIIRINWS